MESSQRGSQCPLTSGIPHFFLLHKATEMNFLFSCVLGPDKLVEDARKESSERVTPSVMGFVTFWSQVGDTSGS